MLQSAALKIIYGMKHLYAELISMSGLETLSDRREKLTDRFIMKTKNNNKIAREWFPLKRDTNYDMRNGNKYAEYYARTDRCYKSPIFFYRRRLNFLESIGTSNDIDSE